MFFVTVTFGEQESTREQSKTCFEFETKAERSAFLDGLEVAIGWFEYQIVNEGEITKRDESPVKRDLPPQTAA